MGGLAGHFVFGLVPAGGDFDAHEHTERGGEEAQDGQDADDDDQDDAVFGR
jgi:hypothetical protein